MEIPARRGLMAARMARRLPADEVGVVDRVAQVDSEAPAGAEVRPERSPVGPADEADRGAVLAAVGSEAPAAVAPAADAAVVAVPLRADEPASLRLAMRGGIRVCATTATSVSLSITRSGMPRPIR